MARIVAWLAFAVWLLSGSAAEAVTITHNELPSAYRGCAPHCNVNLTSAVDIGSMNAFVLREFAPGGSLQTSWLIRYSQYSTTGVPIGYMWMRAGASYDLSDSGHSLSLLLDQADLPPGSSWRNDADPMDWDFTVSSDALLNGGASFVMACCGGEVSDSTLVPWSDPIFPAEGPTIGGPIMCASEGCEVRAQLNFIYFMYETDGANPGTARLAFDPARTQSLLYGQSSGYDGRYGGEPFLAEQNFYVVPVPLPPALVLLMSGFSALSLLARKKAAPTGARHEHVAMSSPLGGD